MPGLASTDWLILFLYTFVSIGIGVSMRTSVKSSRDYFQAGRSMPTWVCAIAFIIAGLSAPEVIGLGAAGARFGFRAALYVVLGSIPALLFAGLFVVPVLYASGAISLPRYLGLRFDGKTRALSASAFVLMAIASAGIALFLVARIFEALRIFEPLFFSYGWPRQGIFLVCILLAAVPIFIYVVIAGLRGVMVSQVVQFVLLAAGFLPIVWTGLSNIGGFSGLQSALAPVISNSSRGEIAVVASLIGFVFGASRWMTDFRVLQMPLAAKCADSARRLTVIGAAAWLAVPFLLVLSGAIAASLPTPQSQTIIRNENGAIYHEIIIVPREIATGRGIVPAVIDSATNNPQLDSSGHTQLDYGMATPNVLVHFATTGLLGLAIAALLACLMSGVASGAMAASTVFACDLVQPKRGNSLAVATSEGDANLLRTARWASAVAVVLSVAAAFAIAAFDKANQTVISEWLGAVVLVFVILQSPQFATFMLAIFTKRSGGYGAFAGLVSGYVAAVLHYGLTLPAGANPGLHGGWFGVLYHYSAVAWQICFTIIASFVANFAVGWMVSLRTSVPAEIRTLVYPPAPSKTTKARWKRPEYLAVGVILITLVLALIFA